MEQNHMQIDTAELGHPEGNILESYLYNLLLDIG